LSSFDNIEVQWFLYFGWKLPIHASFGTVFWGFDLPKWGGTLTGPPKGTSVVTTPFDVLSVKIGSSVRAGRDPKNKVKKGRYKKPKHVTCHVFAVTTHVVAAPPNFAWVVLPPTWLYILGFIEIRSGFSEPQRVENLASPLL